MADTLTSGTIQTIRYILGLSWIYQGVFPKLLNIAPIEREMTAAMGFDPAVSGWITRAAGVGEALFGLTLIVFYRQPLVHWMNIAALIGLLVYVAVLVPHILIEAFNPVTTNLPLIGLSLIVLGQSISPRPSLKTTPGS